jgi:hypothetical protein
VRKGAKNPVLVNKSLNVFFGTLSRELNVGDKKPGVWPAAIVTHKRVCIRRRGDVPAKVPKVWLLEVGSDSHFIVANERDVSQEFADSIEQDIFRRQPCAHRLLRVPSVRKKNYFSGGGVWQFLYKSKRKQIG